MCVFIGATVFMVLQDRRCYSILWYISLLLIVLLLHWMGFVCSLFLVLSFSRVANVLIVDFDACVYPRLRVNKMWKTGVFGCHLVLLASVPCLFIAFSPCEQCGS